MVFSAPMIWGVGQGQSGKKLCGAKNFLRQQQLLVRLRNIVEAEQEPPFGRAFMTAGDKTNLKTRMPGIALSFCHPVPGRPGKSLRAVIL